MGKKVNLLFLCTGNSCRSQMAEGWTRHLKSDEIHAFSAGVESHGLNPDAVKVMSEAGVDISDYRAKHIDEFKDVQLDVVIIVCSNAKETCPVFSGNCKVVHYGFNDPPEMAKELADKGTLKEEQLDCYRKVRDEIKAFVKTLPESLINQSDKVVRIDSDKDNLRNQVRNLYSGIANEGDSCCGSSCYSSSSPLGNPEFSTRFGYTGDDLSSVPPGANMGLGCGNPQAIAQIKQGEVVLDLGAGGGFDCFLAAKQVGSEGKVIGVDMTPEMISKARENAHKGKYANVEFRLGEIEHLPVADSSVDLIISNCVINLSPAKDQVFQEAYRVLRPKGRLALSDVVAIAQLPNEVSENVDAHCGCVAGAALVGDIEKMLKNSGFSEILIDIKEDSAQFISDWFPGSGMEKYVRSALITAVR
ncbi:MAG: arsenite methyltransferase [Desulforegulaceae bacterium]|nr:arsenite methyltransferase [Desulforegulaceae bacterium]